MSGKRSPADQLDALYDQLVDAVLAADEAMLDALLREEGRDPQVIAEEVQRECATAARVCRTQPLREARARYTQSVAHLRQHRHALPETPAARRALLARVLHSSAVAREALTLQHREFRNLGDEDVASLLAHLAALGVLPPDEDPDGGSSP